MEQRFPLLLRASFKKVFEEDDSITPELVKEELYKDFNEMTLGAVRTLLGSCCNILRQAGFEDNLSVELMNKNKLSESQQAIFQKFWAQQRENARKALVEKSRFQSRLTNFQWRVDSVVSGEKSEPTTVVELSIGEKEKLHFEMNQTQLKDILATMEDLRNVLEETSK